MGLSSAPPSGVRIAKAQPGSTPDACWCKNNCIGKVKTMQVLPAARVILLFIVLMQICSCRYFSSTRDSANVSFYCPTVEELTARNTSLPEVTLIRAAVFAHQLCFLAGRPPAGLEPYGAVVLIAPETDETYFVKPDVLSVPLLDVGEDNVKRDKEGNKIYKATNSPALLLEVSFISINGEEATAQLITSSSPYDVVIWQYSLKKSDDRWIVTQARIEGRA